MLIARDIASARGILGGWRSAGESVAVVPTMGNLHEGHLALMDIAAQSAHRVVATIFVNAMQFDRADEVASYPRTFKEDCEKLIARGVDLLFCPDHKVIYPHGTEHQTRVELPGLTEILCGAHRPGHFTGVTTVVTKLFNILQPDVAVFGEKDYQQLQIIRRVVEDLNQPVSIVAGATVREVDGLAMSSRNSYLSSDERRRAPLLHRALRTVVARLLAGERAFAQLERAAMLSLRSNGFEPEYVQVLAADLGSPTHSQLSDLVVLGAAWLGKARLIDNLPLRKVVEEGARLAAR